MTENARESQYHIVVLVPKTPLPAYHVQVKLACSLTLLTRALTRIWSHWPVIPFWKIHGNLREAREAMRQH